MVIIELLLKWQLLEFDGSLPHSIRPQSFIGPQYRFTIQIFLKGINFNEYIFSTVTHVFDNVLT